MKITEFKPGRRVYVTRYGSLIIGDGILSKELKIGKYHDCNSKYHYYVKCCIIKTNGRRDRWPLCHVEYVKNNRS